MSKFDKYFKQRQKPKVTVITITYNLFQAGRIETFEQCLESIQSQTYPNIEHIIIDGASTDGTVDFIKKYKEKNWVEYFSEPDEGIFHALNNGIKHAKGKYTVFLHSDDFFHHPEGVEKSVEILEKHCADYSYADSKILLENDKDGGCYKAKIKKIYHQFPYVHQTMFVKTDILKKEGGFDTGYKSAADYDLMIRLALKKYKGVKVPLCFTTFRKGGFSGEDIDRSLNECHKIYLSNYTKYCRATEEEVDNLFKNKIISNRLTMEFLKRTRPEDFFDSLIAYLTLKVKK